MGTPSVELQILRESQDRALHMEGIPMFVALVDERAGSGIPVAPDAQAEGGRTLAARLGNYRSVLAGEQRETDMGVVISVLTAAAYEDFNSSVTA